MPAQLPYLASNKNVGTLFEKIASAKIPPKFTHEFLTTTIGLKGTNDRQLIPLLRNLGFLDQSSTPTAAYSLLKGADKSIALADGIKEAYAPLFAANENAHELIGESLKSLVAQVAGSDDDMTGRIAATFSALTKLGDFKSVAQSGGAADEEDGSSLEDSERSSTHPRRLRTEFHYNIQVHLPSNGSEETYLNIFNAIRKTFE
ncbi:MAG: DUF5343 domain-containing protein [Methyloceanibacter sp.]|uniref:DUF5343 domain-containing protein n=1 Tax=Methyloceanibacter sp. TaxID=1965321 RepID=UPI001E1730FE|nr:DUF5343 domain-containing protein [Methyloceanibacter sp.]MCB1441776.1 DUF5343 domain-containing protein [Methyloceanibacter sp.]